MLRLFQSPRATTYDPDQTSKLNCSKIIKQIKSFTDHLIQQIKKRHPYYRSLLSHTGFNGLQSIETSRSLTPTSSNESFYSCNFKPRGLSEITPDDSHYLDKDKFNQWLVQTGLNNFKPNNKGNTLAHHIITVESLIKSFLFLLSKNNILANNTTPQLTAKIFVSNLAQHIDLTKTNTAGETPLMHFTLKVLENKIATENPPHLFYSYFMAEVAIILQKQEQDIKLFGLTPQQIMFATNPDVENHITLQKEKDIKEQIKNNSESIAQISSNYSNVTA